MATLPVDGKILDRIAKLYELSKDPSNQHEAEIAATKMADMLLKHDLTLDEVRQGTAPIVELKHWNCGRTDLWYLNLMHACGVLCNVSLYNTNYGRKFGKQYKFVGRRDNVKAAEVTFNYLHQSLELLAEADPKSHGREASRAWWIGATEQIWTMAQVYMDERQNGNDDIRALVHVTKGVIDKYMKDLNLDHSTFNTTYHDTDAYEAGQRAASTIDINGATKKYLR